MKVFPYIPGPCLRGPFFLFALSLHTLPLFLPHFFISFLILFSYFPSPLLFFTFVHPSFLLSYFFLCLSSSFFLSFILHYSFYFYFLSPLICFVFLLRFFIFSPSLSPFFRHSLLLLRSLYLLFSLSPSPSFSSLSFSFIFQT